jgi:hypothetical protein
LLARTSKKKNKQNRLAHTSKYGKQKKPAKIGKYEKQKKASKIGWHVHANIESMHTY